MDTSASLRFGLRALERGLIDSQALLSAWSICTRQPETSLAAALVQGGWITAGQREEIESSLQDEVQAPRTAPAIWCRELTSEDLPGFLQLIKAPSRSSPGEEDTAL